MSDNKLWAFVLLFILSLVVVGTIEEYLDYKYEEKMAEQGYEQVVEDGKIIWQKRR